MHFLLCEKANTWQAAAFADTSLGIEAGPGCPRTPGGSERHPPGNCPYAGSEISLQSFRATSSASPSSASSPTLPPPPLPESPPDPPPDPMPLFEAEPSLFGACGYG